LACQFLFHLLDAFAVLGNGGGKKKEGIEGPVQLAINSGL
jgi:hypothetical protein